jgi:hypothetical protein
MTCELFSTEACQRGQSSADGAAAAGCIHRRLHASTAVSMQVTERLFPYIIFNILLSLHNKISIQLGWQPACKSLPVLLGVSAYLFVQAAD